MKTGKIHSFQSLGTVDGPGIRFVVFMQGCPYRCPYCHNPDTRSFSSKVSEYSVTELVAKIKRFKPYFHSDGGVTVSGGEPLYQTEFLIELFEALKRENITTALDTAGKKVDKNIEKLLALTDFVLCDLKFSTSLEYEKYLGIKLSDVLDFLAVCQKLNKQIIIRHVVVPGMTDSVEHIEKICQLAYSVCSPIKIELLPFKKLCTSKYNELGIDFPLKDVAECSNQTIEKLKQVVKQFTDKKTLS